MSAEFVLRLVGAVILASVGWTIGEGLSDRTLSGGGEIRGVLALAMAGAAFGLLLTPYFTTRPADWMRRQIRQIPANFLLAGTSGLVLGLLIAALLALPLSFLPNPFGQILPLIAVILCAYLGVLTLTLRERDLLVALRARLGRSDGMPARPVLLDTSVIIDGRIADVSQTGFIEGTMMVPRFILAELQHIADSSDALRRNRGRRGLDILNKLQKDAISPITITDLDVPEVREADAKLIALARQLNAAILTNDFNLNKVAELEGIKVLNINELANAVKTSLLPGESIRIRLIQEGKEPSQGVGYLDDGTMVVVEDARRHLGQECDVAVTRVLQTVAGRMIFGQLSDKERDR